MFSGNLTDHNFYPSPSPTQTFYGLLEPKFLGSISIADWFVGRPFEINIVVEDGYH